MQTNLYAANEGNELLCCLAQVSDQIKWTTHRLSYINPLIFTNSTITKGCSLCKWDQFIYCYWIAVWMNSIFLSCKLLHCEGCCVIKINLYVDDQMQCGWARPTLNFISYQYNYIMTNPHNATTKTNKGNIHWLGIYIVRSTCMQLMSCCAVWPGFPIK